MPLPGSDDDRLLRDGEHDDRDLQAGLVDLRDQVHALDPALEQRVDEDRRPGGAPPISPSTREPSLTTSSSLIADCELSSPRMYCATWGTSSTTRRRIWSGIGPTLPRRPARGMPAPKVPSRCDREGHAEGAARRAGQGLRATMTTRSAPGSRSPRS